MTTQLDAVPDDLVVDFDIYDPALAGSEDHFQDEIRKLAKIGPLVYSTAHGGHWMVLDYDLVHEVLRDPQSYSSWPNSLLSHGEEQKLLPLELDPPVHTAYRQSLQPLFSPTRMKSLEPKIRGVVNELIDRFADRGEAEFVSEFAHELPAKVFLALMDLPLSDAPKFTDASSIVMGLGEGATSEEARNAAQAEMATYLMDVVEERRSRPADSEDVTSQLVHGQATIDGETRHFTTEELTSMMLLLLIAGLHTVQGSLGWGVAHLTANPEQRQKLIEDASAIPAAVEEILRIEASVCPGRRATQDTVLGGRNIKKDDRVLLVLCAANGDSAQFDDPQGLDVARTPNRHLSFGAGPHRCLGSHLARIELRIAFEELFRRIPTFEVDRDRPQEWHSSAVRGVIELPIKFVPEPV